MIGPHAGFRFSGPTAAWAYKNLAQHVNDYDRVVVLGPSHKVFLDWVATTECTEWETPLGNIRIDQETIRELVEVSD